MRLYKITATPNTGREDQFTTQTNWVGSQADAASVRKSLVDDGWKRVEILTEEIDVPTNKDGLIKFLNGELE
mgnify:FL=1